MNEIVNNILLVGDKFVPEMHLKQPGFANSACGPFTRNKERIDFFLKKWAWQSFFSIWCGLWQIKDLAKRAYSGKVVRDKAFKIVSDLKYDGYQRGLVWMVYKFFDRSSSGSSVDAEPNYQPTNELHRQNVRKFKRRKIYSSVRENILGVDLADMQSLSKKTRKESSIYCVQFICLVSMLGLFL